MLREPLSLLLIGLFIVASVAAAWMWPHNTPLVLSVGLFLGGIVLLIAEALLPTHGILGIAGLLCFGGVIAVCFYVNRWFGLSVFAGSIVCSPLLANVAMKVWMRSPVGRRLILQSQSPTPSTRQAQLGQVGTAVTEMRPIGECDFGDLRLEAASELGIIAAGRKVKVVALVNGRPTVRATET